MFRKNSTTTDQSVSQTRARTTTRRTVIIGAVAGLLSLAVAAPASAYSITSRANVPVAPTIYQVQGRHYDAGQAVTGPMYKPWIYQPGPLVSRTAPSGTEYVQVTYTVQKWNGSSWVTVGTQTKSGSIASSVTSTQLPALSMLPSGYSGGYFRVSESITWTNPIGAVIGSMKISMNQSGDYRCQTTRTCSIGAGWVYLG